MFSNLVTFPCTKINSLYWLGDKEIMCDPLNDEEITNKIVKLLNDNQFYLKKIEDGLNRSKLFSYEKMHEEIINLYEDEYLKKM